ncbi:hypothetical protein RFEPED_1501 [Rickettsia felis str. Pedreira]|uniref:Uncharacterized protein n=1 Tax=Rickettsia felis str. Pedreira TaxID=1359196 RepID=A0A0F3MUJ7_RICFI|nr:hypothetical protein [Rickettsia felis]KJV59102.1 hypothetical protein RFEPED_1501 [Rickettsia felis str. Pedreira]
MKVVVTLFLGREDVLLYGSGFRHCEKNYVVIRRSNLKIFDEIATSLRPSQ